MFSSLKRGFSYEERPSLRIIKENISQPILPERDWASSLPDSSYLQQPRSTVKLIAPQHCRNRSEPVSITTPVSLPTRRARSLQVIITKNLNKSLPPTPVEDSFDPNRQACNDLKPDISLHTPALLESELAVKAATESLQEIIGGLDAILQYSPSEYGDDEEESHINSIPIVPPLSIRNKAPSVWKTRMTSTEQEIFIKRLSSRLSGLNCRCELVESPIAMDIEVNKEDYTPKGVPDVPVDIDIVLKVLREDSDEISMDIMFSRDDEHDGDEISPMKTIKVDRRLTVGSRKPGPVGREEKEILEMRRRGVTFTDSPTDDIFIDEGVFGDMDEL